MTLHYKPLLMLLFASILSLTACVNSKEAIYFNRIGDSEFTSNLDDLEPVIQKNDLLSISVSSLSPEASLVFNVPNASATQTSTSAGNVAQASGYLVDQDGYIQFPFLGNVRAEGMTKKMLKEHIVTEVTNRKLLLEPIVNIRYLNYKVSVLGEVAHPSVLTIPNEKVTLLEAIGLAGDMTLYARRDNVMLIREEGGKKKVTRIDLTTKEIFTSPYYHLKSNDIVYVEPNKSKIDSTSRVNQWLPVFFSALSFGAIVLDRLTR